MYIDFFRKKTGLILLFAFTYFNTLAQSDLLLEQTVQLSKNWGTVKEIIEELQTKSGLSFAYSNNEIPVDRKMRLNSYNTVQDVLNQICNSNELIYLLLDSKIILRKAPSSKRTHIVSSKKYTISGYLKEKGSGDALIGAAIYLPGKKIGTVTNASGFYSLKLPGEDSLTIIFSYVGKSPLEYKIYLNRNFELNAELNTGFILKEVEVMAENQKKVSESVQMSNIIVPIAQTKNVPALLGEKDMFKVIQLLPGVQKGSEGQSGIYVRGGGSDQNLIILDEAIVYNAFHSLGLFSLFNGDALKSMELVKGGFPARYGGRLSSVIDMSTKEGDKEKLHGSGGIGLISSRLTLEGPIVKNKASFLVSARRTYFDLLIKPFLSNDTKAGYYFYDFNGKLSYDLSKKNKLYLSGYCGRDKFLYYFKEKDESQIITLEQEYKNKFYWGNEIGNLRWNYLPNSKFAINTALIFTHHKFGLNIIEKTNDTILNTNEQYISEIRDFTLKNDWDFLPDPKHTIRFGMQLTHHRFIPSFYVLSGNSSKEDRNINLIESSLYLQDLYKPFPRLQINGGIRVPYLVVKGRRYLKVEPRLSTSYNINDELSLKASYALMNQYMHLLSSSGFNIPMDACVPVTKNVAPSTSQQISLGIAKDFSSKDVEIMVEGYYKNIKNILAFKEGSGLFSVEEFQKPHQIPWEQSITSGQGWSYGGEFFLQKKMGKFSGWIGYTLSWSQLQFDSLNSGKKFYARYDRRHDVSLVSFYKISKKILLSATWIYGTGNAITLPSTYIQTGAHDLNGATQYFLVQNYDEKNSFRMAPYHRLDIGIQFNKKKKRYERTWEVNIYNVYNRKNPFFYSIEDRTDPGTRAKSHYLTQVSLFPILPSISYSFKF